MVLTLSIRFLTATDEHSEPETFCTKRTNKNICFAQSLGGTTSTSFLLFKIGDKIGVFLESKTLGNFIISSLEGTFKSKLTCLLQKFSAQL